MVKAGPRIGFNSAALIRLLADLAVAEPAVSKQPLAERLGLWLGWADAISLATALNGPAVAVAVAVAPAARPGAGAAAQAADDVARVRADLAQAFAAEAVITQPITTDAGGSAPDTAIDDAVDFFSPYRRHHQAQQRLMAARIGPLRARVRAAVARASPQLGQLAALDAALDEALGARERRLLATVPGLMARRFQQLRQAQALANPAGWLAVFCSEMQAVLRAEMDLRLQPIDGLVDAMGHGPWAIRNDLVSVTTRQQ